MTKFCESCHTPNNNRAKYCRGCAGKFSGILTPAASFSSTVPDGRSDPLLPRPDDILAVRRSTVVREPPPVLAPRRVPIARALFVIASLSAGLLAWYWGRAPVQEPAPGPIALVQPGPVTVSPAATPQALESPPQPLVAKEEPEPAPEPVVVEAAPVEPQPAVFVSVEPEVAKVIAPPDPPPVEAPQEAKQAASAPPRQEVAPPPPRIVAREPKRRTAANRPAPAPIAVAEVRPLEPPPVEAVPAPRPAPTGAGPAVGSMTRCDRLNPFGEALCMDSR
jgi:hypothetical protein